MHENIFEKYDISIHYFFHSVGEIMKIFIKKVITACAISGFMIFLLLHSALSKEFASLGLKTWFENMIPALLPFMILSGILIRLNLAPFVCKPLGFLLKPFFQINDYGIYVIVIGFFCGFPMGAKSCTDLYKAGRLSKNEAQYLLAFTNHIGPVYFISYVLSHVYQPKNLIYSLFLMFLLPLLYGLLLRHTVYRTKIIYHQNPHSKPKSLSTLFDAVDLSITGSLVQIASLGGYMILFNLLIVPFFLLCRNSDIYYLLHSLTEISGGLALMGKANLAYPVKFFYTHTALSFNGLCCMFQTLHILKESDLSGQKYMLHKLILCSITIVTIILFR